MNGLFFKRDSELLRVLCMLDRGGVGDVFITRMTVGRWPYMCKSHRVEQVVCVGDFLIVNRDRPWRHYDNLC